MKKIMVVMLAAAMMLMFAASCEESAVQAVYTVVNTTGTDVEELYIYEVGAEDKGENYAADGMQDGASVIITKDAPETGTDGIVYVIEFKPAGQDSMKFETLHFETVTINLLNSADIVSGATPIAFSETEETSEAA